MCHPYLRIQYSRRGLKDHKGEERYGKEEADTFCRGTPLDISVSSGGFHMYTKPASTLLHLGSVNSISSKLSYDGMRTRTVW